MKKVEVPIEGTASTFLREGEDEEQAKHRLAGAIMHAEQSANESGEVRVHLSVPEQEQ